MSHVGAETAPDSDSDRTSDSPVGSVGSLRNFDSLKRRLDSLPAEAFSSDNMRELSVMSRLHRLVVRGTEQQRSYWSAQQMEEIVGKYNSAYFRLPVKVIGFFHRDNDKTGDNSPWEFLGDIDDIEPIPTAFDEINAVFGGFKLSDDGYVHALFKGEDGEHSSTVGNFSVEVPQETLAILRGDDSN